MQAIIAVNIDKVNVYQYSYENKVTSSISNGTMQHSKNKSTPYLVNALNIIQLLTR
jgi:hypothetical protein